MKSIMREKMNQKYCFPGGPHFVYALFLRTVFAFLLIRNTLKKSNLAVFYLGSTMRANQIALIAVSSVVSSRNLKRRS